MGRDAETGFQVEPRNFSSQATELFRPMPVIAVPHRELHRSRGHDRGEAVSRPEVDYSEMASERPKTLRQQKCPPIQPPQCSGEKISKQSRRQSPSHAVECSLKVATPIRRKSLQGLQQHRSAIRAPPTTNGRGHASQNIT